jgi:hypothetical protein
MSNYSPSSTGDRLYCGALMRPKMLAAWSKQCKAGLNRRSACLIWKNKNGCRCRREDSLLACELIVGRDHCTAQGPSPHRRRCVLLWRAHLRSPVADPVLSSFLGRWICQTKCMQLLLATSPTNWGVSVYVNLGCFSPNLSKNIAPGYQNESPVFAAAEAWNCRRSTAGRKRKPGGRWACEHRRACERGYLVMSGWPCSVGQKLNPHLFPLAICRSI